MDYYNVSRIIFLVFVIVVSVYFIIINKSNKEVEHFETIASTASLAPAPRTMLAPSPAVNVTLKIKGAKLPEGYSADAIIDIKDKRAIVRLIIDLYKANKGKDPTETDVDLYLHILEQHKVTIGDLNDIIAGNKDTLRKVMLGVHDAAAYQYRAKDPVLGTEDDVIFAFNEILNRNPDNAELRYYSKKLKEDSKEFNIDKLKQLLISSNEYKRLDKTQNNQAHTGTLGNVTDRQLTLVIATIYKEEAKEDIDDDTLKFLKRQYVQFQLNDETLRKFIRSYVNFEKKFEMEMKQGASTGVNKVGSKDVLGASLSSVKGNIGAVHFDTKDGRVHLDGDYTHKLSIKRSGGDVSDANASVSSKMASDRAKPNSELIKKLERLYETDDSEYLNSSKVIKSLLHDVDECEAPSDKDALEKRLQAMDKQLLAELVYDRNMDHMKNVCRRNQKYLNADQDMVLFPEFKWSVPQKFPPVCTPLEKNEYQPMVDQTALIGTLLSDASKTKVGSILPKTPHH